MGLPIRLAVQFHLTALFFDPYLGIMSTKNVTVQGM